MKYLVHIFATEYFEDARGNIIYSKIWSKQFPILEAANSFIEYQNKEFGRYSALYEKESEKWKLISDTRV